MLKQIYLPNGCKCSNLTVSPNNWEKKNADVNSTWYIIYWFYGKGYDSKTNPKAKIQRRIKGMNECGVLAQKQAITRELLANEHRLLMDEGFNPITGEFNPVICNPDEIDPRTPLMLALNAAFKKMKGVKGTLDDIKSAIKGIDAAARALNYDRLPVNTVSRKHITYLLEKCADLNPRFSPKRHNKYRAWLMKLFKYLSRVEAVTHNPVIETDRLVVTQEIREILTRDQRIKVDKHLKENYYYFWRFTVMFSYSGAREVELMSVQTNDVDLETSDINVS